MLHLALVTIVVPDYDAALEFFVGRLGLHLVEDSPLVEGKRWVVVAPGAGGPGLLLAQAGTERQRARVGDQTGGRVAFFLHTSDFGADHDRLTQAGVTFTEQPRQEAYGRVAVFQDPFGNLWDLVGPGA